MPVNTPEQRRELLETLTLDTLDLSLEIRDDPHLTDAQKIEHLSELTRLMTSKWYDTMEALLEGAVA